MEERLTQFTPNGYQLKEGQQLSAALEKLAQESQKRGGEFISIFYGEGVREADAQQALDLFQAACPEAEITVLDGGQPVYHYLISVE